MNFIIFWAVLMVAFLVLEFSTSGLTAIWFAFGAAGALVSAAVSPRGDLFWLQLIIFLIISGVTMYFTRPLAKKYFSAKETPTNADRVLEMTGIVQEDVSNLANTGYVTVSGKLWRARSEDEHTILAGTKVSILRIEGATLIVVATEATNQSIENVVEKGE